MISRTLASPVEATVPPVPLTWKKSGSLNSHASVVCATTASRASGIRAAAPAPPRRRRFGELAIAVGHAAETSSMKNTTACSAG